MSDPQAVADILMAALIGLFVYTAATLLAILFSSEWFINTRVGKSMDQAWTLIRDTIDKILPPYKR